MSLLRCATRAGRSTAMTSVLNKAPAFIARRCGKRSAVNPTASINSLCRHWTPYRFHSAVVSARSPGPTPYVTVACKKVAAISTPTTVGQSLTCNVETTISSLEAWFVIAYIRRGLGKINQVDF